MKTGICYVVGAGDCYQPILLPTDKDYVIAVDGGYDTLRSQGIKPDVIIGDFDSVQSVVTEQNVIQLKPEKDDTDMLYSVNYGAKLGYTIFYIYGGTGGKRISHTIANIQLLAHNPYLRCFLFDREEVTFLLANERVSFLEECEGYVSVLSFSDKSTGVWEKGLKYELEDATLTNNYPLGVSNEFVGKRSFISVKDGKLLISIENRNLGKFTFKQ
ncbi:MAG: thiamine diphosphokinase [Lachnospiraceae bacterium]|nr:thiamine diphosphokinase [Lachnospiraceae bacterium]